MSDGSRILTHTDVTAEVRGHAEILNRDALMKDVIAKIDYGVILVDEDSTVEFANKKFCDLMKMDQLNESLNHLDLHPSSD